MQFPREWSGMVDYPGTIVNRHSGDGQVPGIRGGLNGSAQHLLGVYSQEFENLRSFSGVDLSAALLCQIRLAIAGQVCSLREVLS
jgi:hypothetical protein